MTNKEAILWIEKIKEKYIHGGDDEFDAKRKEALQMGISALEQEPCNDAISRATAKTRIYLKYVDNAELCKEVFSILDGVPSVKPSRKGQCKECKYFEYDSVAKVDGVPLIVAHEICNKWGDGCKTREDGYCFLFESADMRGAE